LANWNNITLGNIGAVGSSNTITLGGLSGTSASGQFNISDLSFDWSDDSHVKKYQVYEIEEDLLALSTTWQRLRYERNTSPVTSHVSITRLLDKELFRHVTNVDRERASTIRDYYSKKIMVWRLKNERFSKYRDDLNEFVHGEGNKFREEMCPLVYRLPEFYDYDSSFEEIAREHNIKVKQTSSHFAGKKTLSLVKTFNVGKKYSKRKEYWFSDEDNDLVSMSIEHNNVLIPLLDSYVAQPFKLDAIYSKKIRDEKEYLVANKFKFA
jgi:hypothetical protein